MARYRSSPWRFQVELIDKAVLVRYMAYRNETCRSLAHKVGCSHGTIGHLRTGYIKRLNSENVAKAIERELNAPPGSLFVPKVSRVSVDAA